MSQTTFRPRDAARPVRSERPNLLAGWVGLLRRARSPRSSGSRGSPRPPLGTRPDVSIVTAGHDVADARLHRLVAALQREGGIVQVLGLGEVAGAPSGVQARTWDRPGLVGRALLAVRLGWLARGRAVVALDPDTLVAVRVATWLRRRPLVADVHEDYSRLLSDRGWATGVRAVLAHGLVAVADRAAAGAALTLVADEHVPPFVARERLVVRNEPDLSMLPALQEPAHPPRAVYVGDVRSSRGLFDMLDALVLAPQWRLDLVGPVAESDRRALKARLDQDPHLARRITWYGRLPPGRSWQVTQGAWVGLCLLHDTPAFHDAVPSKLYEYLAAGLVPLASDLPRQRSLLAQSHCGVVVADAAEAAGALRRFAADPEAHLAAQSRGLAWARGRAADPSAYDLAAGRILGLVGAR